MTDQGWRAQLKETDADRLKAAAGKASGKWELDFLDSMTHRVLQGNTLTKKQRERVAEISCRRENLTDVEREERAISRGVTVGPDVCPEELFGAGCEWVGLDSDAHYVEAHRAIAERLVEQLPNLTRLARLLRESA